jgi:hypothetical protein
MVYIFSSQNWQRLLISMAIWNFGRGGGEALGVAAAPPPQKKRNSHQIIIRVNSRPALDQVQVDVAHGQPGPVPGVQLLLDF